MQVLSGVVILEVAGQSHALATGDAVAFPGDLGHSYANAGPEPARFSLAVFEPGVGAPNRTERADG